MGLTSRRLGGAVGSCEVVGVRVGLCVGGEDYYVWRRTALSVMGLSPAPLVLARPKFVGGAPSVMVLRR
jgi:hypothetical protein